MISLTGSYALRTTSVLFALTAPGSCVKASFHSVWRLRLLFFVKWRLHLAFSEHELQFGPASKPLTPPPMEPHHLTLRSPFLVGQTLFLHENRKHGIISYRQSLSTEQEAIEETLTKTKRQLERCSRLMKSSGTYQLFKNETAQLQVSCLGCSCACFRLLTDVRGLNPKYHIFSLFARKGRNRTCVLEGKMFSLLLFPSLWFITEWCG